MKLPVGMWARPRRNKPPVYYYKIRKDGILHQGKLSEDLSVAKKKLIQVKLNLEQGDGDQLATQRTRWIDIVEPYLVHKQLTIKTWKEQRRELNNFTKLSGLEHARVSQINHVLVDKFIVRRKEDNPEISPRTINKQLKSVKACLDYAVSTGMISRNPIENYSGLPCHEKKKVRRALGQDEARAIINFLPPHLKLPIEFMVRTGLRRSEVSNALFEHINNGHLKIYSKRKLREIPIVGRLIEIIEIQKKDAENRWRNQHRIFVNRAQGELTIGFLQAFYSACGKAGIEGAHPNGSVDLHALRATFATLSIDAGSNPKAVQAILGHSKLEMTMNVYAKSKNEAEKTAINNIEF